jgi:Domain of unknown function (DUF4136)
MRGIPLSLRPSLRVGSALLIGVFSLPCLAEKVQTYTGKEVDFARYKTYQWLPPRVLSKTGIVENDPEIAPVIKVSVNRELVARGLKEVAEGGDLQVATTALAESIPQMEAVIFPGNMAFDYATPLATFGRYNRQGTLVVNLIDSQTKKSAWAGLARETIDNHPGAGKEKVGKATSKLFKKFPLKRR